MKSVSIIGIGRVGGALAIGLSEKGYLIENLVFKTSTKIEQITNHIKGKTNVGKLSEMKDLATEIIFITTQDSEIESVVDDLKQRNFKKKTYIFHTSGSISSDILSELKGKNCLVASIHPLVSISDPWLGIKRFDNAYFCVEGEDEAVNIAEKIVQDLGGKPFSIETKYKSLYHASAVTACGHLVAVIDMAMEMLQKCGLESNQAKEILMPLIKSTIENIAEQKNSEALTGTFARADVETLKKHIETINENASQEILGIYLSLGQRSLKLSKEQGVDQVKLDKMTKEISLAKNNLKC